jgi:predicted acetyltransferase
VRIEARTLAALWSGFATPEQLGLLGAIEGSAAALSVLGAVFASGTPAMSDMF